MRINYDFQPIHAISFDKMIFFASRGVDDLSIMLAQEDIIAGICNTTQRTYRKHHRSVLKTGLSVVASIRREFNIKFANGLKRRTICILVRDIPFGGFRWSGLSSREMSLFVCNSNRGTGAPMLQLSPGFNSGR